MDSQSKWTLSQLYWERGVLDSLTFSKKKRPSLGVWTADSDCMRTRGEGAAARAPEAALLSPVARASPSPQGTGTRQLLVWTDTYGERTKRKYITYISLSIHEPKINSISMLHLHN